MSEIEQLILNKVEKIEDEVGDIKVAVTKNTADLAYHIKRTDDLQVVVENFSNLISPLHEAHVANKAVDEFKKKQREDLLYKLKIPGAIVSALAAIGVILTWLLNK